MALLQAPGNRPLCTVHSSRRSRYGIMASHPILVISPGILLDPTDLFFLIVLKSMVNGFAELIR